MCKAHLTQVSEMLSGDTAFELEVMVGRAQQVVMIRGQPQNALSPKP